MTEWAGVTFGEAGGAHAGRVVEIWLEDEGLTGEMPAALGGLTALTMLDLSGNQLTGEVPGKLWGLTTLTVLDLGEAVQVEPMKSKLRAPETKRLN